MGPSVAAVLFRGVTPVFAAETHPMYGYGPPIEFDEALELEAGLYTLCASAEAACGYVGSQDGHEIGGGGTAEYDIALSIIDTM